MTDIAIDQTSNGSVLPTLKGLPSSSELKALLPHGVNAYNTDLSVHINHFPLGDVDNFAVTRAAMAKALSGGRMNGRAWDLYAPWEKQYLHALARVSYKAAQSEYISGQDGGFLAPEAWNKTWFGLLRSVSALDQLPITRLTVPARVQHLPLVVTDVTLSYPGENVAPTATNFGFAGVTYTARKAVALMNLSNELIRDAGDLADALFRDQTAKAIATDRDQQLLVGSGTNAQNVGLGPTGLINHPTILNNFTYYPVAAATGAISQTPGSFTPSYQHVAQLMARIETLHGFTGVAVGQATCDGMIAHQQFKQTVLASPRFQDAQGRPLWLSDLNAGSGTGDQVMGGGSPPVQGGFLGMKWALSGVIPINLTKGGGTLESLLIGGWWSQYVLFECLTLGFDSTVESGTSTVGFQADQTQIKVIHRYDGGPSNASAFGVLAGVLV